MSFTLFASCWLRHRFDGSESVVIVAAQKRTLGGRELQLPCMSSLTSKTSTQKFFLRVLQVIIQLREDTRRANKKAKQTGRLGEMMLHSRNMLNGCIQWDMMICWEIIPFCFPPTRMARLHKLGLSQQHSGSSASARSRSWRHHPDGERGSAGTPPPTGTATHRLLCLCRRHRRIFSGAPPCSHWCCSPCWHGCCCHG